MKLKHTKIAKIEAAIDAGETQYALTLAKASKAERKKIKEEIGKTNDRLEALGAMKRKLESLHKRERLLETKLELAETKEEKQHALSALESALLEIEVLQEEIETLGKEKLDMETSWEKLCLLDIDEESQEAARAYAERFSWASLYEHISLFWSEADKKK